MSFQANATEPCKKHVRPLAKLSNQHLYSIPLNADLERLCWVAKDFRAVSSVQREGYLTYAATLEAKVLHGLRFFSYVGRLCRAVLVEMKIGSR